MKLLCVSFDQCKVFCKGGEGCDGFVLSKGWISFMLVKRRVHVWYKIVFIKFTQPRYSWELACLKLNCHLLNCNVQIMIFCWLILILIQLPQNTGADERERKRLTLGIFWISATHRESRFYLFIILLEIHFQQHKGLRRYSKRVCLPNAAWFIILFDVKRFCVHE